MPNQHTVRSEREQAQATSRARWERERTQRVEAICAAITYNRQTLAKVGNAHLRDARTNRGQSHAVVVHLSAAGNGLRDALAEAINEPNPFDR